jgi:hypothetical protein
VSLQTKERCDDMANRHILHISILDDFRKWLIQDGWEIQPEKGYYEVLRAKKKKRVLIVYFRFTNNLQHYSILDKDVAIVKAFLKDRKRMNDRNGGDSG